MKVTVYTIKDCAFSKQEKEYLNANKLGYVEKDLETNKDFLTEMLAVSNNFAGTPVTRVEKDDGSIAVLKGFTKEEFDTTFGFAAASTDTQAPTPVTANDTPITSETGPKVQDTKPAAESIPPVEIIQPESVLTDLPPVEVPATPDPLKSVMNDLQSKSQITEVQPTMPPAEQPTTPTPSIPDFSVDTKATT